MTSVSAPDPPADQIVGPSTTESSTTESSTTESSTTESPTTERILDAALAEFSTFGLRRSSMEDVARRARVARGTVYRKFAAKDALVQAVILREGHRFMAEFATVVDPYPAIADKLVEGWVFALSHLRGHRLFSALLLSDPEAMLPYLTVDNGNLLTVCRSFVARFLRDAQRRGELELADFEAPAELMVRIVMSYVVSPDGCLDLADEQRIRAFARRHLVPIVVPIVNPIVNPIVVPIVVPSITAPQPRDY